MLVAKIYVSRTDIKAEKVTPVTAGMVGAEVDVYFGREWDGYAKTYVWEHSGVSKDDTTCSGIIPPEVVVLSGGTLKFGVFGTKDGKATPTLWCTVDVVKPGADPSGDESTDPTLPVWAQLHEEVENLKQGTGTPGKDGATFTPNVDEDGNLSWTNDKGLGNPETVNIKGPKGDPGEDGFDYVLTDADKQEIAEQAAELVEVPDSSPDVNGGSGIWYGTTSTNATTAEKVVTTVTGDFKLVKGARLGVKFLTNTVNCNSLIVDGLEKVYIRSINDEAGNSDSNLPIVWHNLGQVQWFTYDGEYFIMDDAIRATAANSLCGKVAVSDSVSSTGNTVASSTAVKTAYDKAVEALNAVPNDEHINSLINTALGVIENGSY